MCESDFTIQTIEDNKYFKKSNNLNTYLLFQWLESYDNMTDSFFKMVFYKPF